MVVVLFVLIVLLVAVDAFSVNSLLCVNELLGKLTELAR